MSEPEDSKDSKEGLQVRPRRRCVSSSASLTPATDSTTSGSNQGQDGDNASEVEKASGSSPEVNLTSKLNEMTLESPPPPGKIRRRNALPSTDLFLKSREMQQLEEQYLTSITEDKKKRQFLTGQEMTAKALQKEFASLNLGSVRRKKAFPRSQAGPTSPLTVSRTQSENSKDREKVKVSGEEDEVGGKDGSKTMHISLHDDLKSFSPTHGGQIPPSIIDRFHQESRELKGARKKALMVYKPRPTFVPGEKPGNGPGKPEQAGSSSRVKRTGMMTRSSSDAAASYSSLDEKTPGKKSVPGSGSGQSPGLPVQDVDMRSSPSISGPCVSMHHATARIVSLES